MAAYTAIDDPEAYFQPVIYTGNGSADHAITLPGDTDMQPDLVWIKNRDATDSHCLFDAVRGATKLISSDSGDGETTDADTLDSFATDGFQVDADVKVNTNTEKYVAWCWKANGTGSSDTTGSINSTATSASTASGFSIVKFTGTGANATVGHGLGIVPKMMFVRNLTSGGLAWRVHNSSLVSANVLYLNQTDGSSSDATSFNSTAPTSSLFSVGSNSATNESTSAIIAYCFADIQGFSKFGSYTGNGNADGTFVYTGFRPAYVMVKRTNTTGHWVMWDSTRDTYNLTHKRLYANLTGTEYDGDALGLDLLSNGFKFRVNTSEWNGSGDTHIYMAFAEAPFVNSNGVPCNAR
jgi:hypothetical protein